MSSHVLQTCRVAVCLAAALLAACSRGPVDVYVTTADATRLLARDDNLGFGAPAHDTSIATITVDDRQAYQEMIGFGAALTDASAWLIQHRLSPAQRDSLLRDLFGPDPGAGFSFVRIDMGASDFALHQYSYDDVPAGQRDSTLAHFSIAPDTAETIPLLRRALAINPQLKVMASPWSAPAWMKTSQSMIRGSLRPDAYDAYAEYFHRFISEYTARGVPIFAITVQNEPDFEPADYPGMRLGPAARAELIGRHLGPLLARTHTETRILDWDHNWDDPKSPLAVLADSSARRYVGGVAWHCYAGDVSAQTTVHDAFPDKDAYFTECSGGDWSPKFADNLSWMVHTLVIGATRNWARGVLLWNLALDTARGPHLGGCGNCRGVVTIDPRHGSVVRNEEYYALAHASRFVRPGARRIQSNVADKLDNVAFRNTDGSRVLIVLNADTRERRFEVLDSRMGGRTFRYRLPGGAVATFRWR